jgi:hypothetical protein
MMATVSPPNNEIVLFGFNATTIQTRKIRIATTKKLMLMSKSLSAHL